METSRFELEKRVEREKEAHVEDDILRQSHELKNYFYHIRLYPSLQRLLSNMYSLLENVEGRRVLDLGCGRGELSIFLLEKGARVCGIDISSVYISEVNNVVEEKGLSKCDYDFKVMDAHSLDFEDNSFDIVVGDGVLHHLDLSLSLREIYRVLKVGGIALFREPLAANPLLKAFRRLTPNARTQDEKPMTYSDLRMIKKSGMWRIENDYCGILCAPIAVATSIVLRPFPNNFLLKFTAQIESILPKSDFIQAMNQYVLFKLIKQGHSDSNRSSQDGAFSLS